MVRTPLLPLASLYQAGVSIRNIAFDRGWLRVVRFPAPIIAVGNLTAGGTGKTPVVEFLVGRLRQKGKRVGVVSRGYGRGSRGVVVVSDGRSVLTDAVAGGDEPVQIARKFPGAVVVVAERRAEGIRVALDRFGVDIIVLDDAFQHRWVYRDLNILLLDAREDIRKESMLPAGMRREPLREIRRAHLVAWSSVSGDQTVAELGNRIAEWWSGPAIAFQADVGQARSAGAGSEMVRMEGASVYVFSGIAKPVGFEASVRGTGSSICGGAVFRDHHRYTPGDIESILGGFAASGATLMVTTEKDVVRMDADPDIRQNFLERYPVYYLPLSVRVREGMENLERALAALLKAPADSH